MSMTTQDLIAGQRESLREHMPILGRAKVALIDAWADAYFRREGFHGTKEESRILAEGKWQREILHAGRRSDNAR